MDPFSISIGCFTLLEVATKTIKQLFELSRRYHDARSDLLRVMTQLRSLSQVLELIQHDEATRRTSYLESQIIMDQVNRCMDIIEDLEVLIASINDSRLTWAITGKPAVENIYKKLQTETKHLELILDVHALAVTKEIKNDTSELLSGQNHISDQIKRLSEHMGLMDEVEPTGRSVPSPLPSWSRTSQGVYVEINERHDAALDTNTNIHQSTINEEDSINDTPSRGYSSQWSGSTAHSRPCSVSTPTINIDAPTQFVTPSPDQCPVSSAWSNYQYSTADHTVFWNGQLEYPLKPMVHDTVKVSNELTVEHVEAHATPSKEETIRNQFKQATWSLVTKKDTKKQKVNSIAESFKEMVRVASLKTASVTT